MKRDDDNEKDWEFGDVWKQAAPDQQEPAEDVEFVEILRTDTGRGFDDSTLLDMVSYLGSLGIRATYDSFSLGLEGAAIKTYALKVESGREDEAVAYLKEKMKGQEPR